MGLFNNLIVQPKAVTLNNIFIGTWYTFNTWTRLGLGAQTQSQGAFVGLMYAASIPTWGFTLLNHMGNRPGEWVANQVMPLVEGLPTTQKMV